MTTRNPGRGIPVTESDMPTSARLRDVRDDIALKQARFDQMRTWLQQNLLAPRCERNDRLRRLTALAVTLADLRDEEAELQAAVGA
jgi:hypothetical protein